MDLFRLVGEVKTLLRRLVPLGLGVLDEGGVHGGELVGLSVQGSLQIGGRIADAARGAEMGERVHRLRGGNGPEHLCDAGITFLLRLGRESQRREEEQR